ncbi:hypothetical protein A0H81_05310 [Grifola frondosa]|uniref:Uncharacterized protein n=1 Tax=Grifola frondosa TaxID=5627 RepID=A0A1C7MEG7_GRIFR|nr:hypothetical protein A0H81_05310 [Grifola frondosa]
MAGPVTDIDVAEITKIADQLARRERFLLEQQQWRSNEDRLRGYKEVQVKSMYFCAIYHAN